MRSHGLSTARLTSAWKHAAAPDLETRVPGPVQLGGQAQQARGADGACVRLLGEQADGAVDEMRHGYVTAQARWR